MSFLSISSFLNGILEEVRSTSWQPMMNTDGTPMIQGTMVDVEGKGYGVSEMAPVEYSDPFNFGGMDTGVDLSCSFMSDPFDNGCGMDF